MRRRVLSRCGEQRQCVTDAGSLIEPEASLHSTVTYRAVPGYEADTVTIAAIRRSLMKLS